MKKRGTKWLERDQEFIMPGRIRLARSLSAPVEVQISARGNAGARARELANVWVPQIPGAIARCIRNAFHGRLHSRPRISFCGERDRHEARSIISLRKPQSAFQCSFVRLDKEENIFLPGSDPPLPLSIVYPFSVPFL